jgi:hypothetical protein
MKKEKNTQHTLTGQISANSTNLRFTKLIKGFQIGVSEVNNAHKLNQQDSIGVGGLSRKR